MKLVMHRWLTFSEVLLAFLSYKLINNSIIGINVWGSHDILFYITNIVSDTSYSILFPGRFINLSVKFKFRRRIGYSLLQVYAPTFLIVSLSWLSFWISKEAVPARVALGITTVLTIVTLMASFRQHVPKVIIRQYKKN